LGHFLKLKQTKINVCHEKEESVAAKEGALGSIYTWHKSTGRYMAANS